MQSRETRNREEEKKFTPIRQELGRLISQYVQDVKTMERPHARPVEIKLATGRMEKTQERFNILYGQLDTQQRNILIKTLEQKERAYGNALPDEFIEALKALGGDTEFPDEVPAESKHERQEKKGDDASKREKIIPAEDRYINLCKVLDTMPDDDPRKKLYVGKLWRNRKLSREESPLGIVAGTIEDDLGRIDERLEKAYVSWKRDANGEKGVLHELEDAGTEAEVDAVIQEHRGELRGLKARLNETLLEHDGGERQLIKAAMKFIDSLGDLQKQFTRKKEMERTTRAQGRTPTRKTAA